MADIFISYAREDRACAERIADLLEGAGLGVWWDRNLHAGDDFERVIDARLRAAKAVVVIWSRDSAPSHWVRSEAAHGLDHNKLVSVLADGALPPRPYDALHALDLSGWRGGEDEIGLQLIASVRARMAGEGISFLSPAGTQGARLAPWIAGLALAAVIAAGALYFAAPGRGEAPAEQASQAASQVAAQLAGRIDQAVREVAGESSDSIDLMASRRILGMLAESRLQSERALFAMVEAGNVAGAVELLHGETRAPGFDEQTAAARTKTLHQLGALAFEAAPEIADEAYRRILEAAPADFEALRRAGRLRFNAGRFAESQDYLLRASQIEDAPEESRLLALSEYGFTFLAQYDTARALEILTPIVQRADAQGYDALHSFAATNVGQAYAMAGEAERAREILKPMLVIQARSGFSADQAKAYAILGELALIEGDHVLARLYIERGLDLERRMERRRNIAMAEFSLGRIDMLEGDQRSAEARHRQGLAIALADDARIPALLNHLGLADALAQQDRGEAACAEVAKAEALHTPDTTYGAQTRGLIEALGCGFAPLGLAVGPAGDRLEAAQR